MVHYDPELSLLQPCQSGEEKRFHGVQVPETELDQFTDLTVGKEDLFYITTPVVPKKSIVYIDTAPESHNPFYVIHYDCDTYEPYPVKDSYESMIRSIPQGYKIYPDISNVGSSGYDIPSEAPFDRCVLRPICDRTVLEHIGEIGKFLQHYI